MLQFSDNPTQLPTPADTDGTFRYHLEHVQRSNVKGLRRIFPCAEGAVNSVSAPAGADLSGVFRMKNMGTWGSFFRGVIWCCAFGMAYLEVRTVVEYVAAPTRNEIGPLKKDPGGYFLMSISILPAFAVSFVCALLGVVRPALTLAAVTLIAVIMFVIGVYLAGPITFSS